MCCVRKDLARAKTVRKQLEKLDVGSSFGSAQGPLSVDQPLAP